MYNVNLHYTFLAYKHCVVKKNVGNVIREAGVNRDNDPDNFSRRYFYGIFFVQEWKTAVAD